MHFASQPCLWEVSEALSSCNPLQKKEKKKNWWEGIAWGMVGILKCCSSPQVYFCLSSRSRETFLSQSEPFILTHHIFHNHNILIKQLIVRTTTYERNKHVVANSGFMSKLHYWWTVSSSMINVIPSLSKPSATFINQFTQDKWNEDIVYPF